MASNSLPTRQLASITVPDTPLIAAAISFARAHLDDMAYNHVMRSFLFGFAAASKIPPSLPGTKNSTPGPKLAELVSREKRFEVDGAEAAREFVRREAGSEARQWDEHRLQLLWDAIALHTTNTIAQHKEIEVQATLLGIASDFLGPNAAFGSLAPGLASAEEWEAVRQEFPRGGFTDGVREILCGFCRTKPETTYDNFVGDFGDEVEGYERVGKRFVDAVLPAVKE